MDKGFTLLEISLAIAIISIITIFSYRSFVNLNENQILEKNVSILISVLEEARSLTISGKESQNYGVHMEDQGQEITLFKGDVYDEEDESNRIFVLDNKIMIFEINLQSDGEEIVFKRLKGETLDYGTITLAKTNDTNVKMDVTIYNTGTIQKSN